VVLQFTQETHAQRAVCAALRLHQRVQTFVTTLDPQLSIAGTVRCGVHTGLLAKATVPEIPYG